MAENRFDGLDALLRRMRDISQKSETTVFGAALRAAANRVKYYAQARAKLFDDPTTPEQVYRQIIARSARNLGRQNDGIAIQVGVKDGAKRYVNSSRNRRQGRVGASYEGPGAVYYWRFLEFGTEKMGAQPFMTPALQDHVEEVTSIFTAMANKRLDKFGVPQ